MTMRDYSYLADHVQTCFLGYWLTSVRFEKATFTLEHYVNPDDMSEGITGVEIPYPTLAAALWIMREGGYVQFDGTLAELNSYHAVAARDLLSGPTWADDADADSDTWDVALQMATFGRVLYS